MKLALNGLNHHFQQAILIRGLHILHILDIEKWYKETLILYIFVKLPWKQMIKVDEIVRVEHAGK